MRPGWKTTEFYQAAAAQVLALLTLLGVVSSGDSQTLQDSIAKCVTAICALAANGWIVVHYIKCRFALKTFADYRLTSTVERKPESPSEPSKPNLPVGLGLAILSLWLVGAPAQAQSLLPWRNSIAQQLRQHDQQIAQLLNQQRSAPVPNQTPPPQPIVIVQPPLQSLPIQGQPRQTFPIGGQPKQTLPIGGQPEQALPVPGQPQQAFPMQGTPQPLPIAPPTLPPAITPGTLGPQAYSIQRALASPIP